MIGYIKGRLLFEKEGVVLLENNGIGYEISCSNEALKMLLEEKEGGVYTYMAVREDNISLFGFISQEEKEMFLKLISVSGVGPKMGIGILSCMNVSDLSFKIASEDIKGLSLVKGLGKKTAERIILELKDKVDNIGGKIESATNIVSGEDTVDKDSLDALMGLGFTKAESMKALLEAKKNGANTPEQLIAFALRHIK